MLRPAPYALDAIACPTTRLCVATDGDGDVLTSTVPTRRGSWTSDHIGDGVNYECFHYGMTGPDCQSELRAVSCAPGSDVCVATDDSGRVFVSSNPIEGTWVSSGIAGSLPVGILRVEQLPGRPGVLIIEQ